MKKFIKEKQPISLGRIITWLLLGILILGIVFLAIVIVLPFLWHLLLNI